MWPVSTSGVDIFCFYNTAANKPPHKHTNTFLWEKFIRSDIGALDYSMGPPRLHAPVEFIKVAPRLSVLCVCVCV